MTVDIKIRWDTDLMEGDFIFEDNDFQTDDGLGTAVLISWFTDQRADDEDPIPNAQNGFIDKRGWWGDLIDAQVEGDQIGSKLWLLNRSKTDQATLNLAVEYGEAALKWMIDDGIVKEVTVTAERLKYLNNDYILALQADITKLDGNKANISFDPEWFATWDVDYN